MQEKAKLVELTADIAAAYLSANTVPAGGLPQLIQTIHQALSGVSSDPAPAPAELPLPAVPIKKSTTPDYLVSLEDGKKYKSLKRHLRTKYNMTPDEYRSKWGLPKDYPMVAPNYAKARSEWPTAWGSGKDVPAVLARTRSPSLLKLARPLPSDGLEASARLPRPIPAWSLQPAGGAMRRA